MTTKLLVFVSVALSAGVLMALHAADEPKNENNRDFDKLAQNVASRSARIKEGDLVAIRGQFTDAALLETLAVKVRKQGGHPLVIAGSDRLLRRLIDDVPAQFDSQEPKFALKMAEIVDAEIFVRSSEEEAALAGVPVQRLAATAKAQEPVRRLLLKRNVRLVELGNGLYPTASRAKQYGLSQEQLANIFWDGLNVDYTKMQSTGEELQRILSAGKELQLTNANGTDLKMKIEKRPVLVSDGNLTPEKLEKGGAAVSTWLPAGEVYVAPVTDSAEGKVIIERIFFEGREVTGLTMTLKAGKVTDLRAAAGGERLLDLYKAADAGKEKFGVLDVGINPNVRIPRDSKLLVYMAAGMVSVWTGNNTWAGGDNNAMFGVGGFLPGSTLKVDGKVIVEKGALKL